MAETGTIGELHPPGNGTGHGVAFIIPAGGGKKEIAHTPDDNNGEPLTEGAVCYYTMEANGKHVASVSHTDPDANDGGGGPVGTDPSDPI